jgi:hypothetical protein
MIVDEQTDLSSEIFLVNKSRKTGQGFIIQDHIRPRDDQSQESDTIKQNIVSIGKEKNFPPGTGSPGHGTRTNDLYILSCRPKISAAKIFQRIYVSSDLSILLRQEIEPV